MVIHLQSPSNAVYVRTSLTNATLSTHYLIKGNANSSLNYTTPFSAKIPWLRVESDNIVSVPKIAMNDIKGVIPSANLL